jgi:hypothetical protein
MFIISLFLGELSLYLTTNIVHELSVDTSVLLLALPPPPPPLSLPYSSPLSTSLLSHFLSILALPYFTIPTFPLILITKGLSTSTQRQAMQLAIFPRATHPDRTCCHAHTKLAQSED